MTDRIKGFTVTLSHDISIEDIDDIDDIKTSLEMIKGVASVKPSISNYDDLMNSERIKWKLRSKLFEFIKENF